MPRPTLPLPCSPSLLSPCITGGAAIFRTMADSRTPMLISFLMNAVNIGGNALLIFVFHMEIAGAAIPTLVSRIVAAVVVLSLLCRERYTLSFTRPFTPKLELHTVGRILGIGIPNGIENGMFQFGKIMVVSLISSFGTVAITANAVGNAISVFQILPGFAIGTASVPIVSRCFGAGESRQIRYYTSRLLGLAFAFNILINIVLSLAIPLILQLYQLSEDTMGLTTWVLLFSAVSSSTIWPAAFMLPNAFRATGDVKYTMIVSVASMWIFRVGLSYVLGGSLGLGSRACGTAWRRTGCAGASALSPGTSASPGAGGSPPPPRRRRCRADLLPSPPPNFMRETKRTSRFSWVSFLPLRKGPKPLFPVLFPSFPALDALGEQVLNLPVDGAEILLSPGGQFLPQLGGDAQQELLFRFFLLVQNSSPFLLYVTALRDKINRWTRC